MSKLIIASSIFLWAALSGCGANAFDYVDTSGKVIKNADLGQWCRPTWQLDNGDIMIFSTSEKDVAFLRAKLIESGMTDETRLNRWIRSAQNNDCTNRAGLDCEHGTCSSGACQVDINKNGKACLCK